jgi:hypothetical protein
MFVLMSRIVKRMTSDSDGTWQDSPSADVLAPRLSLGSTSAEYEPCLDGSPRAELIGTLPCGKGRLEGACFRARAEAELADSGADNAGPNDVGMPAPPDAWS